MVFVPLRNREQNRAAKLAASASAQEEKDQVQLRTSLSSLAKPLPPLPLGRDPPNERKLRITTRSFTLPPALHPSERNLPPPLTPPLTCAPSPVSSTNSNELPTPIVANIPLVDPVDIYERDDNDRTPTPGPLTQRRGFKGAPLRLDRAKPTHQPPSPIHIPPPSIGPLSPLSPPYSSSGSSTVSSFTGSNRRMSIIGRMTSFIGHITPSPVHVTFPINLVPPDFSAQDPFARVGSSVFAENGSAEGRPYQRSDLYDLNVYDEYNLLRQRSFRRARTAGVAAHRRSVRGSEQLQIYEACNPDVDANTKRILRRGSTRAARIKRRGAMAIRIPPRRPPTPTLGVMQWKTHSPTISIAEAVSIIAGSGQTPQEIAAERARKRDAFLSSLASPSKPTRLRTLQLPRRLGLPDPWTESPVYVMDAAERSRTRQIEKLIELIDERIDVAG